MKLKEPKLRLEVVRFSSEKDSTNGILFDITQNNRRFLCYTLEDEHREQKIKGETRIPEGRYEIALRTFGGFHGKYAVRFADIHSGMLWVRDVPGFSDILIHCGNTDENTAGCLLLGDTQENNQIKPNGFIGHSTRAYMRVYPLIAKVLEDDGIVDITYTDWS